MGSSLPWYSKNSAYHIGRMPIPLYNPEVEIDIERHLPHCWQLLNTNISLALFCTLRIYAIVCFWCFPHTFFFFGKLYCFLNYKNLLLLGHLPPQALQVATAKMCVSCWKHLLQAAAVTQEWSHSWTYFFNVLSCAKSSGISFTSFKADLAQSRNDFSSYDQLPSESMISKGSQKVLCCNGLMSASSI